MRTELKEIVQNYRPLATFVPEHWQTSFVEAADGTHLHYTRTGGDKPALVLLHGVQVNGLTWLRVAQAFESAYDVIMPDFRGHGESSLGSGASSEILVNDTSTIMRVLGLQNPFVVGHSMGADIAGRLAAVYPLRGVVLVDPSLRNMMAALAFDMDAPPAWMQGIFDTMRALKAMPHAERMIAGLGVMPPGNVMSNEIDYVSYVDAQAQFDLNFYRYMAQLGYLFEAPDVIASITCPILLLTARSMMPAKSNENGSAAFTSNWRNGQHIHFEDSGHAIMSDQFEKFVEVVTSFLHAH